MSREQTQSALWIGTVKATAGDEMTYKTASAIALGTHVLLTNAHVWSEDEAWDETELLPMRKLFLAHGNLGTKPLSPLDQAYHRFGSAIFELVAAGEMESESGEERDAKPKRGWSTDWALLKTETHLFLPGGVAHIYPPAQVLDWVVPDGTELFVIGFSLIFMGDSQTDRDFAAFVREGPYTLRGKAKHIGDVPGIEYSRDWPRPGGHSGGGVFLWSDETQQLELIGVMHSWVSTKLVTSYKFDFLGLSALRFKTTTERETRTLEYAPIAQPLRAMKRAGLKVSMREN